MRVRRRRLLWAVAALVPFAAAFVWAAMAGLIVHGPVPWAAGAPAEVRFDDGIVYATPEGTRLKLDLARPAGQGPFPVVLCIHGGGWHLGGRASYTPVIRALAAESFAAASIDYRLAPKWRFPAQIEDARAAARYLRAHSRELGLDPKRFAVLGESAGGHLALLLGLMDAGPECRMQAVVNYYGPTDFRHWHIAPAVEPFIRKDYGTDSRGVMAGFLGTSDPNAPVAAEVSPITHVSAGDPPVLTFHGTLDPLVPVEQARLLHAALRKAGVPETLVTIPGGMHGWGGREAERTNRLALEFLRRYLGPAVGSQHKDTKTQRHEAPAGE